jgi:hypothetical protein
MKHRQHLFICLSILLGFGAASPAFSLEDKIEEHDRIERVSPEEARSKSQAGTAVLVCSYSDQRCEGKLLEGALTRSEFESRMPSLPKDQEIITYCA